MFGISVESILEGGGLLLVAAIVFAECGLLAGFFLPGDTLLLSAGYFAAIGKLPLGWLIVVVVIAAAAGDNVGYEIGRRAGRRLFNKPQSTFFHPDKLKKAEEFYIRHGGKTVMFARFVPLVRTFAPVVAGAGNMPRKRFAVYNFIGACIWGVGTTMLGFILGHFIGSKVINIDKYILLIIIAASVITMGPAAYHLIRAKYKKD